MEKQPDEPVEVKKEPVSLSEPMEVQDYIPYILSKPFALPTNRKTKAQKQREYRQRIAATRTPDQAAAARRAKNERQRKNRLRQAAISSGYTEASSSCSGEESNVQTRSQRQNAQQQSTAITDQPENVNVTNESLLPPIPVPAVQEVASATPFAKKTRAQVQREYRQRIAATRTPEQKAAAREARNERERNFRLRQANLGIASGDLEATTSSSCSWQSLPLDSELKKQWIDVIPGNLSESSVDYALHFKPEDYRTEARKRLKPGVVPSIFTKMEPTPQNETRTLTGDLENDISKIKVEVELQEDPVRQSFESDSHKDSYLSESMVIYSDDPIIPPSSSNIYQSVSEYDAVGINVAKKLAKMKPNQAILAESIINNVLRRGLLDNLKDDTDLYDMETNVKYTLDNRIVLRKM